MMTAQPASDCSLLLLLLLTDDDDDDDDVTRANCSSSLTANDACYCITVTRHNRTLL